VKRYINPRIYYIFLIFILMLFIHSCASSAKVWVSPEEKFNNAKIAMVGFDIRDAKTDTRLVTVSNQLSEGLAIFFLNCGFNVIERNKIDLILQEMKIQTTGILSQDEAIKLGQIANVKYIVHGNGNVKFLGSYPLVHTFTLKMTNVENGKVVVVNNWNGFGKSLGTVIEDIGNGIVDKFKQK
jgi:hypothetical protein